MDSTMMPRNVHASLSYAISFRSERGKDLFHTGGRLRDREGKEHKIIQKYVPNAFARFSKYANMEEKPRMVPVKLEKCASNCVFGYGPIYKDTAVVPRIMKEDVRERVLSSLRDVGKIAVLELESKPEIITRLAEAECTGKAEEDVLTPFRAVFTGISGTLAVTGFFGAGLAGFASLVGGMAGLAYITDKFVTARQDNKAASAVKMFLDYVSGLEAEAKNLFADKGTEHF